MSESLIEAWRLTTFVEVGCLAVLVWDILHSLAADYQVLFKRSFNIKTFTFLTSRISTLSYMSVVAVQMTRSNPFKFMDDYTTMKIVASVLFLVGRASTALLFYFRVIAIYQNRRSVVAFFTFTWFLSVAGGIVALGPIWNTMNIIPPWEYFLPGALTEILNDSLVFLAISRKIRLETLDQGVSDKRFHNLLIFRFTNVQRFAETFLQDSQIYYLIAIFMNLAMIITYFSVNPQSPCRIMLIYPNTVVMHIMATKVYRNLRLGRPGLLVADSISTWVPTDPTGSRSTRQSRPCNVTDLQFIRSGPGLQRCSCGRRSSETRFGGSRGSFDVGFQVADVEDDSGRAKVEIKVTTSIDSGMYP